MPCMWQGHHSISTNVTPTQIQVHEYNGLFQDHTCKEMVQYFTEVMSHGEKCMYMYMGGGNRIKTWWRAVDDDDTRLLTCPYIASYKPLNSNFVCVLVRFDGTLLRALLYTHWVCWRQYSTVVSCPGRPGMRLTVHQDYSCVSVSPSVRPSVYPLWRVSGSQLTPSQKLVHHSTERLGSYRRGAIEGAYDSTTYG